MVEQAHDTLFGFHHQWSPRNFPYSYTVQNPGSMWAGSNATV
jgi:hypothetical protein